MSQANIAPAAPIQDPLVVLQSELQAQRDRMRRYAKEKLAPDDPRQDLYNELDSTVLSFQADLVRALIHTRDFLYGQIVEEVGALDERLDAIEEPETQFTAEDAADFGLLCDGAELLAKESTWKDKKKRDEFIALISKCRQTIEEGLLTEGDDEEEEADEAEEEVIGGSAEEPSS
jgi:hypothetical protein